MPVRKLRCIHHNGLQDQHKYKEPKHCGKVVPCSSEEDGKPGICPDFSGGYAQNKKYVDETGLPNTMICFKKLVEMREEVRQSANEQKPAAVRKRAKSRELRGGILYVGCDCERRNGLQDSCPRSECQGSPECLTVPPTCLPSEFANGKHLAKTLWKVQRQQALEAKRFGERNAAMARRGAAGQLDREAHYDCFPIDLEGSAECPLCLRAFRQHEEQMHERCRYQNQRPEMPAIYVGPIYVGVAPDCDCCDYY